MDTGEKIKQEKESIVPPRQIYELPLPEDTARCKGCPYPRVGFICWSKDGSCLRTDMDRLRGPGR